jgi:hypothetical protein
MTDQIFTEEEVQDLTDRVFLLREQLEAGKIHFAAHLVGDFRSSLGAIRLRPDGLVDPETVDSRIRAATLMIRAIKYRDEAKKSMSLGDIQEAYFKLLFQQFGHLLDQMRKAGATPSQAAQVMKRDEAFVRQVTSGLPEMAKKLKEFWEAVGDSGAYHLQDGTQLKATFAGDLFPAHWENAVSTAGLYIDTIILPCPIMRIAPLIGILPEAEVSALLVKHTLTAMTYRDIATTDITPPIALILPNPEDFNPERQMRLLSQAEPAMLKHAAYLFGRSFTELAELEDFCTSLRTVTNVAAQLKGGERLIFDTAWGGGPVEQLTRAMAKRQPAFPGADASIAGHHVLSTCLGRMPQALGAQENALHFGGTPLINAQTSWQYYTWLLEYESTESPNNAARTTGMHVARALVSEVDQNLSWLGNVPPETVLAIRKSGLADDLRSLLSAGIGELIELNPTNYFRTADQVVANLDHAFQDHQRKLLEARDKKLKLYGLDIGSFVATGAIAVTAALTGNPTLGAVSVLLGMAGPPNLRELKSKFKTQAEDDLARKSSPTGLLFRHVK